MSCSSVAIFKQYVQLYTVVITLSSYIMQGTTTVARYITVQVYKILQKIL